MKPFNQVIAEAEHDSVENYGDWGVIDHEGKFIDGHSHPTATAHAHLVKHVPRGRRGDCVCYAQDNDNETLNLATHTKAGLSNILKHWGRLPHHESNRVLLDHRAEGTSVSLEGPRSYVLQHVKGILGVKQ